MTPEEEHYWRGYIDATVANLGKTRTHHPSEEKQIEYRDKLMIKYKLK